MSKPRVVVTGDLLIDQNLRRDERFEGRLYSEPLETAVATYSLGGAWFLRNALEQLIPDSIRGERVVGPEDLALDLAATAPIPKAYTIWKQYREKKDSKADEKPRVWRVETFLGCERVNSADSRERFQQVHTERTSQPADVLVIDDLHLGFGETPELWPEFLQSIHRGERPAVPLPQAIIVKVGGPLKRHALWNLLSQHSDLQKLLSVVVFAGDLRTRGAALSRGLSWDRTIEELNAEFDRGLSAYDLAGCGRVVVLFEGASAAAIYSRGWLRLGKDQTQRDRAVLQRFLYRPDEAEGAYGTKFEGRMFGASSLIVAGLVLHALDEEQFPLYIALGRSLSAIRDHLQRGEDGGDGKTASSMAPHYDELRQRLLWQPPADSGIKGALKKDPAHEYFTAYHHGPECPLSHYTNSSPCRGLLKSGDMPGSTPCQSDLLGDIAGPSVEYMYALAQRIVREGSSQALEAVPQAVYEGYRTVDREEIERINTVRALIESYLQNLKDDRPLSIAVFGQPGSGKGYAIKQLIKSLPGLKAEGLTFNLSEFSDDPAAGPEQLHKAFHQVRDLTVLGKVPLVFWDEFDTDSLRWLKHFLAPMQDHEFRDGSIRHPLGRAIFVFAGATSFTFQDFERRAMTETDRKGPDFVSRLRGHINIKGPNPDSSRSDGDPAHVVRRALILRNKIEDVYHTLLEPEPLVLKPGTTTRVAHISDSVLRSLLRVKRYHHGVRSMESVLSTSRLAGARTFGASQLPPPEQLAMHVSDDFLKLLQEGELTADIIEPLAQACYEGYRQGKPAAERASMPEYVAIDECEKEKNRFVARVAQAKLADIGYVIRRVPPGCGTRGPMPKPPFSPDEISCLAVLEHDRWLRELLIQGFEYGTASNRSLRRNSNIGRHDVLEPEIQRLDEIAAREILKALWEFGFEVVRA
jgi:hypothetical protein